MKNLSWYILILLVLISTSQAKSSVEPKLHPLFGYVVFCAQDLPQQDEIIDGCQCGGSKTIKSGDGLFSKPCPCGSNCKCLKPSFSNTEELEPLTIEEFQKLQKELQDLKQKIQEKIKEQVIPASEKDSPPLPKESSSINQTLVIPDSSKRIELVADLKPMKTLQELFKPRCIKELWVLFTKENWCLACSRMKPELDRLEKAGWKIDRGGDLRTDGNFHIRIIYLEEFESFPSYFFQTKKDNQGRTIMNHDMTTRDTLSLPTLVYWENLKLKTMKVGFMDAITIGELFNGRKN